MIVKRIKQDAKYNKDTSRHIRDLSDYILNARSVVHSNQPEPETEKVSCSGSMNFSFSDTAAQISEMCALAAQCPRSSNPTNHYALSWQSHEKPTPEQIEQAVFIFLEEAGLKGHQVIYAAHNNTNNIHLHIQANRVNPVSEKICKINNGFDKIVCQRVAARIEATQGWASEPNALYKYEKGQFIDRPRATDTITLCNGARQAEQRTNTMSAEHRAKLLVPELQKAKNWQDFHAILLKNSGFCNLKTSGAVIKFVDNDTVVKCSRVHRGFSRANLEKKFGPYEPLIKDGVEKMEVQQTRQSENDQQPQQEPQQEPQQQPQPEQEPQPEQQEQPRQQEQPQQEQQKQPEQTHFLAAFISKFSASDDINLLKDETMISSLQHGYADCASDKEVMFAKINEDMKQNGITLSTEETRMVSDTIYNVINATQEEGKAEEKNETEPEIKEETKEEKGTLIDLSNIDNPLELLLLLILAVLGIGIARQAAEQAAAAAQKEQEQAQKPEAPAPASVQGQSGQQQEPKPEPTPVAASKPDPVAKPQPQPVAADWAPSGMLYIDVYKFAAAHISAGYAHRNFDPPVGPKLDSAIATRLAVCNYNQHQIASVIAAGSPSASAPDYATTKAAEPFAATRTQVIKYEDRAESWMKEEKKDVIQAQREYKKAGIEIPAELKQKPKQSHGMSM